MRFFKKTFVLKEIEQGYSVCDKPISGIARVEIEEGVANLFLSFVNFRSFGRGSYSFILSDGGEIFYYDLGARPTSFARVMERVPQTEKGFAAGVCFIEGDIPVLISFGRTEECELTVTDVKSSAAEKCLQIRKARLKAEESAKPAKKPIKAARVTVSLTEEVKEAQKNAAPQLQTQPQMQTQPQKQAQPQTLFQEEEQPCFYDDEAVATENYYMTEEEKNDCDRVKNELPFIGDEEEAKTREEDYCGGQDEKDSLGGKRYSEQIPYYLSVKEELKEVFDKFPEEGSLKKLFPDSDFSRVNYSENKFYVVGVIRECGEEKYICYGVPGAYSENAPEELAPYCSFIPLSVFDLSGDGYWMMFQSAVTGECILLNKK